MKHLLIIFILCSIFACQSKQSGTNNKGYIFNEDETPYVVTAIKPYTDSTGKEWHHVILIGPNKETYSSYAQQSDNTFKIGDTVLIGHNVEGEYIVHPEKHQK